MSVALGKLCPWIVLGGELHPCRDRGEGGGGGLQEPIKQQESNEGSAPHNSLEERCFGKGYSDAIATSRENSHGLALGIPLLCSLDLFLHAKQVEEPRLSCCFYFLLV